MTKFILTDQYNSSLERIEDHILTTADISHVEKFLDEHDRLLKFIEQNPATAAVHPLTGDQTWVFASGRYRVFYKAVDISATLTIFMTDIIDNRELNKKIYPANSIPTYDED